MAARRLLIALALAVLGCRAEFGSFGGGTSTGGEESDRDPGGGDAPGGAGGAGGGGGPEDCTSGEDEDGDGLVDCQDHGECGGYLCVPEPESPEQWDGPILLHAPEETACAPGWLVWKAEAELLTNEAEVCACACDPANGQTCAATVQINCNSESPITVQPGQCVEMPFTADSLAAPTRPVGGACAASPATAPPSYERRLACVAPRGGGCDAGAFCARPPPAASGSVCFARVGLHACQQAPYLERAVVLDAASPSLACDGDCECGGPSGGDCSGVLGLHDGAGCAGPAERATTEGCDAFGAALSFASFNYPAGAAVMSAGLCSPVPRAIAAGEAVTTLCCAETL